MAQTQIRIGGFGGQGVILSGIIIGRAAAIVVQTRLLDLLGLVLLFLPTFALALDGGYPRWILPIYLGCIVVAMTPLAVVRR